jgi:hypothetical protein
LQEDKRVKSGDFPRQSQISCGTSMVRERFAEHNEDV